MTSYRQVNDNLRTMYGQCFTVIASVTRRGYFPPKWLLLKPGGGQKLVANRHHKSGYFLATSIFWLKMVKNPKFRLRRAYLLQ